jgi:hypothetical protein
VINNIDSGIATGSRTQARNTCPCTADCGVPITQHNISFLFSWFFGREPIDHCFSSTTRNFDTHYDHSHLPHYPPQYPLLKQFTDTIDSHPPISSLLVRGASEGFLNPPLPKQNLKCCQNLVGQSYRVPPS